MTASLPHAKEIEIGLAGEPCSRHREIYVSLWCCKHAEHVRAFAYSCVVDKAWCTVKIVDASIQRLRRESILATIKWPQAR